MLVYVICAFAFMCYDRSRVISLRLEKRVILSNGSDGTKLWNAIFYYRKGTTQWFCSNVVLATATSEDLLGRYKGVPVLTQLYIFIIKSAKHCKATTAALSSSPRYLFPPHIWNQKKSKNIHCNTLLINC
jgi:hypothetical protein